jgi:hypothetical protein
VPTHLGTENSGKYEETVGTELSLPAIFGGSRTHWSRAHGSRHDLMTDNDLTLSTRGRVVIIGALQSRTVAPSIGVNGAAFHIVDR